MWLSRGVFVVACAWLILTGSAAAQSDAVLVAEARAAFDNNDCVAAERALNQTSAQAHQEPLLILVMAQTQECLERFDLALELYTQLNDIVPGRQEVIRKLGELRYRTHSEYEGARRALRSGDVEPSDPNEQVELAQGYQRDGNVAEAVRRRVIRKLGELRYRTHSEYEGARRALRSGDVEPSDPNEQVELAQGYQRDGNVAEAVRSYRLAAEQGHGHGQTNLGWMYEHGRGVEQNDTEAVRWYRLAAEQGHGHGQNNLGWMYELGRGVEQNDAEAVRWYRLAAEQGHGHGQTNLGWMHKHGRGVEQNDTEAVRWFRLAAEQGHGHGQTNLGWMYERGRGVEQNDTEAVRWFRLAAEQGHGHGQTNLGWLYERGRGVERNKTEAVRLYRLSARQGNEWAQTKLRELGYAW